MMSSIHKINAHKEKDSTTSTDTNLDTSKTTCLLKDHLLSVLESNDPFIINRDFFDIIKEKYSRLTLISEEQNHHYYYKEIISLQKQILHPLVARWVINLNHETKENEVYSSSFQMASSLISSTKSHLQNLIIESFFFGRKDLLTKINHQSSMSKEPMTSLDINHDDNTNSIIFIKIAIMNISKHLSSPNLSFDTRELIKTILEKILLESHGNDIPNALFLSTTTVTFSSLTGHINNDPSPDVPLELRQVSFLNFLAAIPDKAAQYSELRDLAWLHPHAFWSTILSNLARNFDQAFISLSTSSENIMILLLEKLYRLKLLKSSFVNAIAKTIHVKNNGENLPKFHESLKSLIPKLPLNVLDALLDSILSFLNDYFIQDPDSTDNGISIMSLLDVFDLTHPDLQQKMVRFLNEVFLIRNHKLTNFFLKSLVIHLAKRESTSVNGRSIDILTLSLAEKWSEKHFIRSISNYTLNNIGHTLLLSLNHLSSYERLHELILPNLDAFLDFTSTPSKTLGMVLAEEISTRMAYEVQLNFELPDSKHVLLLRNLANGIIMKSENDSHGLNGIHVHNESVQKIQSEKNSTEEGISGSLQSYMIFEDSDDEDEFSPFEVQKERENISKYPVFKDSEGKDVYPPKHIRQCLEYLLKDQDRTRLDLALNAIPSLIQKAPMTELKENAHEIVSTMCNMTNSMELNAFESKRSQVILELVFKCPFETVRKLADIFYEKNTHFTIKMTILSWVGNSAWSMSNSLNSFSAMYSPSINSPKNIFLTNSNLHSTNENNLINDLSTKVIGKTKWKSSKLEQIKKRTVRNLFSDCAETFIHVFLRRFDPYQWSRHNLNTILSTYFVKTMSVLVHCSAHCPSILSIYTEFTQFLSQFWLRAPLDSYETNTLNELHQSLLFALSVVFNLGTEFKILGPVLTQKRPNTVTSFTTSSTSLHSINLPQNFKFPKQIYSYSSHLELYKKIVDEMMRQSGVSKETRDLIELCRFSILQLENVTCDLLMETTSSFFSQFVI